MLGLWIDWIQFVALSFLSLLFLLWIKYDDKKTIVFVSLAILFYVYTNSTVHQFDTKYQEGMLEDTVTILSSAKEGASYDQYLGKNQKR